MVSMIMGQMDGWMRNKVFGHSSDWCQWIKTTGWWQNFSIFNRLFTHTEHHSFYESRFNIFRILFPLCACLSFNWSRIRMHNNIGTSSVPADTEFNGKYRHQPKMKVICTTIRWGFHYVKKDAKFWSAYLEFCQVNKYILESSVVCVCQWAFEMREGIIMCYFQFN